MFGAVKLRLSLAWMIALLALLLVLIAMPFATLLYGSLRDAPIGSSGPFTFANYVRLVTSPSLLKVLLHTAGFAALSVVLGLIAGGIFLAWLLGRTNLPGASLLEALFTIPLYLPPIMIAVAWAMLGAPRVGLLNIFSKQLIGTEILNSYSAFGVVLYLFTFSLAFHLSFAVGAFRTFDLSLEEAGRISGARVRTITTRIIVPLLMPLLSGTFLYSFVRAFEAFEGPLLLGLQANIKFLSVEIYDLTQNRTPPAYPLASALGLLSVALMLPLTWYQWQLLGRRSYVVLGGKGYRTGAYDLGVWRIPAFILCTLCALIVVVLPVSQLVVGSLTRFFGIFEAGFTLAHYQSVISNHRLMQALINSSLLACVGASIAVVLGFLVAYALTRARNVPRAFLAALNLLTWLPLTVPGIVLALGFLWFYAFSPLPLYATKWGLLLAYIILVIPLVVRAMVGALAQVSLELEEAGRVYGAGWARATVRLLLPLVWPAAAIAWVLAFINIVRDLSTSVLLVPPGQPVFSTALLELWGRGLLEQVCAMSVIVMIPMLLARYLVARLQVYETRLRQGGRQS